MNLLKKIVKSSKRHEMVLGCLLVLYILSNVQTPSVIAPLLNNLVSQILVAILALSIFVNVHPILGIVVVIAAFEFIKRADVHSVSYAKANYVPSEEKKSEILNSVNDNPIPKTLEEEVVDKMAPIGGVAKPELPAAGYNPVLSNLHDASSI